MSRRSMLAGATVAGAAAVLPAAAPWGAPQALAAGQLREHPRRARELRSERGTTAHHEDHARHERHAHPGRAALAIGANARWYEAVRTEVPQLSCRRVYYPGFNDIPAAWPAPLAGSTALVSIRPVPRDLLSGRLDEPIRAFARSAPPGSGLTAWHEAGTLPGYPAFITPRAMRAVHRRMHWLCRGTWVRYGPILCRRPDHMRPWMVAGMDWYGLDIYDWPEFHFRRHGRLDIHGRLYPRLDQWRRVVQQLTGQRWPVLNICETNSQHPRDRAKWFEALARWLSANGGGRMLTFWSDDPGAVGPWLRRDTAVARSLSHAAALPR